jgi:hypothetical protein
MEQTPESTLLLTVVGIILTTFYVSLTVSLFPYVLRLYTFIIAKIHEYQELDRGDVLTLLIDAGLSHEQALWFYDKFYDNAACWERCLIKLYIKKHCF